MGENAYSRPVGSHTEQSSEGSLSGAGTPTYSVPNIGGSWQSGKSQGSPTWPTEDGSSTSSRPEQPRQSPLGASWATENRYANPSGEAELGESPTRRAWPSQIRIAAYGSTQQLSEGEIKQETLDGI